MKDFRNYLAAFVDAIAYAQRTGNMSAVGRVLGTIQQDGTPQSFVAKINGREIEVPTLAVTPPEIMTMRNVTVNLGTLIDRAAFMKTGNLVLANAKPTADHVDGVTIDFDVRANAWPEGAHLVNDKLTHILGTSLDAIPLTSLTPATKPDKE